MILGILGLGPEGGSLRDTHCYWRKRNGDITIGYTDEFSEMRGIKEGWVPLRKYGTFQLTGYTADHPYEGLFIRGGAKEMPVRQIKEEGFHASPPLVPTCGLLSGQRDQNGRVHRHREPCWNGAKPVKFPQLNEIGEVARCGFCRDTFPTYEAREQHIQVMHIERVQADDFKNAITGALGTGLRQVARASQRPLGHSAGDYQCGRCGEAFAIPVELTRHLKECRSVVPAAADEGTGVGEEE